MTTELANFIHGERVAAADGQTTDLVDPSTGEVFATAPLSRAADTLCPLMKFVISLMRSPPYGNGHSVARPAPGCDRRSRSA